VRDFTESGLHVDRAKLYQAVLDNEQHLALVRAVSDYTTIAIDVQYYEK
jgi:hypothetical protein